MYKWRDELRAGRTLPVQPVLAGIKRRHPRHASQQNSLLQSLGLQTFDSAALIFVLLILLGVGSALLYWLWTRRPRSDDDAVARALRRKLAAWEKRGYSKATAESVAVFFRRIAKEVEGKQSERLLEAATRYEALRYRKDDNASQLLSLLKRIRL